MGAETSVLEGCEWGPHVDCPPKFPWEMSPITKPDGTSATVFETKNADTKDEEFLRKSAYTLRGLRHPNIIRFIGCGQSSDGFWLATESVLPLFTFISDMSSQELCVGFFDLLQAIDFLHSKLGMCHNNVCLPSIFVSTDGSWKLSGLEFACRFTEATQDFLERYRAFRHENSLAPEEKASMVRTDGYRGQARDVFAFGALVDMVLDLVKEKDDCANMLEQQLSVCLNPDPECRPHVSSLLNLTVFRSDVIEILKFLRHVTAKTDTEKKEFFSHLMPRLRHLPEMTIARRLVVPLLARFVLLDEWAVAHVLPHLLSPKGSSCRKSSSFVQGLLPEHLFRQYVINHIYNIFHVYDCHVRLVLLEHFSNYVNMFTRQQLEDDIFLQILLGVRDTDDRLVAASLRALSDLVPVLGGDFVVGGVRKPFFFHGMPKVASQNLTNMSVPHNMMTILADHKPLLKDLAASSNKTSAMERTATEREKKLREREERREEARLKREERKYQLKERPTVKRQDSSGQEDSQGQVLDLIIEQVGSVDNDGEKGALTPTTDKNSHDGQDVSTSIVKDTLDNENPEWSDWEDTDQQIIDEIELELQAMHSLVDMETKLQTSPSPYRSHSPPSPPPVKVDWSENDVERTEGVHSIKVGDSLHLEAKHGHANTMNKVEHIMTSVVESWGTDLEVSNKTKSEKSQNSRSSSSNNESLKLNVSAKNQSKKASDTRIMDDLGAGFDIKSINIVRRSTPPELDFFAGMTPSIIESKSRDLTSLLAASSQSIESTSTNVPVLSSTSSNVPVLSSTPSITSDEDQTRINHDLFAVSAVSDEEVKGWIEDDEINWDIEASTT
uniref:Protein kinase domain-containing protein n=1 Tax=Arion vulgaris TaxID=1028688 RepID=A0A0B7B076_9EUPU